MRGDDVRVDSLLQHAQAAFQIYFPEGLAEFREGIAAPNIVDKNIQPLVPPTNQRNKFFHLCRIGVIHADRNSLPASRGHQLCRFLNGLRTPARVSAFPRAAPRAINGCARLAQRDGDAPSGAACRAGHQGDLPSQNMLWRFLQVSLAFRLHPIKEGSVLASWSFALTIKGKSTVKLEMHFMSGRSAAW